MDERSTAMAGGLGTSPDDWVMSGDRRFFLSQADMVEPQLHRDRYNMISWFKWVWINTYENTIFRGMTIHKSQLFWCELQGYKVLTHCHIMIYDERNRNGDITWYNELFVWVRLTMLWFQPPSNMTESPTDGGIHHSGFRQSSSPLYGRWRLGNLAKVGAGNSGELRFMKLWNYMKIDQHMACRTTLGGFLLKSGCSSTKRWLLQDLRFWLKKST